VGDVEGHEVAGLAGRHLQVIAALGFVLLEDGEVLQLEALCLLVDLSVEGREHHEVGPHEALLLAVDVGQLLAGGIDLEVVGVGDEDAALGVGRQLQDVALQGRPRDGVGGQRLRVLPLVPDLVEALGPAFRACRLRLLVGLRIVFDVIGRVVVLGCERLEERSAGGQEVQQARVGRREFQLEGEVVDLRDLDRLAADHPFGGHVFLDVLVLDDVVEIEHDVIAGEGCAVGPFVALAEMECDLRELRIPFPGLGDVRHDRVQIVGHAHEIGLPPAQELRGPGLRLLGGAVQGAAILPALVVGHDDERFFRQALRHRRQAAALDLVGEQRIVAEGQALSGLLLIIGEVELLRPSRGQTLGVCDRRALAGQERWCGQHERCQRRRRGQSRPADLRLCEYHDGLPDDCSSRAATAEGPPGCAADDRPAPSPEGRLRLRQSGTSRHKIPHDQARYHKTVNMCYAAPSHPL
jgi:hypothetical protein